MTDKLANPAKNLAKNAQWGLTTARSSHVSPQPPRPQSARRTPRRLWPLALLVLLALPVPAFLSCSLPA